MNCAPPAAAQERPTLKFMSWEYTAPKCAAEGPAVAPTRETASPSTGRVHYVNQVRQSPAAGKIFLGETLGCY